MTAHLFFLKIRAGFNDLGNWKIFIKALNTFPWTSFQLPFRF